MDHAATRPRRAEEIYAATLALLAEGGYDRLSIEGIAGRASVHKTTIYRTWPTKDALLADALVRSRRLSCEVPDTGTLCGDLTAMARRIGELVTDPGTQRIVGALVEGAPTRPETAAAARGLFADGLAREQIVFDRAVARGEIADAAVAETVMNLLVGALWFHVIVRDRPVTEGDLHQVVGTVLGGVGREPAGR